MTESNIPINENLLYSDFDLTLTKNPFTRDIVVLTNLNAIKRSIKNLFQIDKYDIPFKNYGIGLLKTLLFDPVDTISANNILTQVEWIVTHYEPRINLQKVIVNENQSEDGYDVTIYFNVKSLNRTEEMNLFLKRVR